MGPRCPRRHGVPVPAMMGDLARKSQGFLVRDDYAIALVRRDPMTDIAPRPTHHHWKPHSRHVGRLEC
jgi:hypothetical protein